MPAPASTNGSNASRCSFSTAMRGATLAAASASSSRRRVDVPRGVVTSARSANRSVRNRRGSGCWPSGGDTTNRLLVGQAVRDETGGCGTAEQLHQTQLARAVADQLRCLVGDRGVEHPHLHLGVRRVEATDEPHQGLDSQGGQ